MANHRYLTPKFVDSFKMSLSNVSLSVPLINWKLWYIYMYINRFFYLSMRSQEIYLISWLKKIQGKIPFLFLWTYADVLNSFHELGKKTAFCLATTTEIKCAGTGEIRHLMHYSFQDPVLLLVPPARGNDRHWNETSRKPVLLVLDCFGLWMYLSTVDYSICFDRASLLESHCSGLQTSNVHTQHARCITSIPLLRGEFTGWGIYRLIQVPSKPNFWPCIME